MIVAGFPAGSFATNCYAVAPQAGEQCVIIDPGQDAGPGIEEVLRRYRLRSAPSALPIRSSSRWPSAPDVCGTAARSGWHDS